jgi:hypothetical protein
MKEIKLLPINNKIIKKRERINQKKTLHSLKIPKFKEGIFFFFLKSSNSSLLLSQRTGLSFFFKARKKKTHLIAFLVHTVTIRERKKQYHLAHLILMSIQSDIKFIF